MSDQDNKNACIQLPTTQQTYLVRVHSCIALAGQKTRGSSMGSRVARGVRFSLDFRVYPF